MTPEERAERAAFEAALRLRLRERAALIRDTTGTVLDRLRTVAGAIAALMAGQPEDWRAWQLQGLQGQLRALMDGVAGDVTQQLDIALGAAWATGREAVDSPLAAAGINLATPLPVLDASLLRALQQFSAGRVRDLTAEAAGRVDRELGLVVLGAKTPGEAMRTVQAELQGEDATVRRRARTIVNTELGQAYAVAAQQRAEQAAVLVPDLRKQWRRSGKIHSRWSHDALDGVTVPVAEHFMVPTKRAGGFVKMLHPHDPKAPASETINCGCIARMWLDRWGLPPGGTPFSEREVALNPMKAAAAAWRAGRQG